MTTGPLLVDLLVVDDDAPTRRYFELAARGLKLTVRACADPSQARELLLEVRVKLLVTDLHLAGASAEELVQHVTQLPQETRPEIVLMTGGLSDEVQLRFRNLGVQRFWKKPIPLDVLRSELSGLGVAPGSSPPPKAGNAADEFFNGNHTLYARYRAQTLPRLLQDIQAADHASAGHDLAALAGVMHNLKTVLRLIGQPAESAAAQTLEEQARHGDRQQCSLGWRHLRAALHALSAEGDHG
ncbi:response regulator [uncultured Rhodoferax sp.]|uniref:Hpt domain-containing response regulator n=1 Tax=uncultured Rhodoferax sp. TaxID=223188 RepID=UPI0025D78FC8|nr:response regulator [uncultured Rhodoferax sp.]